MLAFQLALRNLLGAGLRTWLNVLVLSFAFVIIIWNKGLLEGWDRQARHDMIEWEVGGGQYWHQNYDPYDPFTLPESFGAVPAGLSENIQKGEITPILICQGTIYPKGRMQTILLKGIPKDQKVVAVPSAMLTGNGSDIPAIIGSSMAESTGLGEGDLVIIRWRDRNGAFDATEIRIAGIFKTNVPTVDGGQVWLPIEELQKMMLLPDEATMMVVKDKSWDAPAMAGWKYVTQKSLLSDLEKIIQSKGMVGMLIWGILLMLAMLAVFDTQVLSIFRRQKEIGTFVAMGMTRGQVVKLFTIEGAMHSVFAAVLGAVYGIPLLYLQATNGISIPVSSSDFGMTMAEKLYPAYSLGLIAGTVIIVLVVTTIVSYWPSRKIAKLSPTDALRGRIQ
jgi:putative ABC transport system permease protein